MDTRFHSARQVCDTARELYDRGFIAATEGNISCRLPGERILCTPGFTGKHALSPPDLCVLNLSGRQLSGARRHTSEILLHLEIYRRNPSAAAVVHCHPPHATAFAISRATLPAGLLAEVEYYLGQVPTVAYHTPGSTALAEAVGEHAASARCAVLQNHGAVSWAEDLQRAHWWMEVLEAYCRIVILARGLGEPARMPQHEIDTLRELGKRV